MRLSDARSMTLSFGRHKGKALSRVGETDRGYLAWLRDQGTGVHETVRKAAAIVLDAIEHPREPYTPEDDEFEPI